MSLGAFQEALALRGHFLGLLLPHGAAQDVGIAQRIPGQAIRDLHHLFLIHNHAVGLFQNLFQLREIVGNLLAAVLAVDEVVNHPALDGAGPVQRVQRAQIFDARGLVLAQNIAHPARFKLENAAGEALAKDLVSGGIIQRQFFDLQLHAVIAARSAPARPG